jgi:hypothetical protein
MSNLGAHGAHGAHGVPFQSDPGKIGHVRDYTGWNVLNLYLMLSYNKIKKVFTTRSRCLGLVHMLHDITGINTWSKDD